MSFQALLVNPWIHDFSAYDFWLKPLGLLTLGESLRRAGAQISLIDCMDSNHPLFASSPLRLNLKKRPDGRGRFYAEEIPKPVALRAVPRRFKRYGLPKDIFRLALSKLKPPDIVLVSCTMTYWYTGAAETIAEIRAALGDVPIIAGGLYPSLLPEHAGSSLGADFIIRGDWEKELSPVIKEVLGGEIELQGPLDVSPAFDLYPSLDYACIQTGRGCPFRCTYCASPVLHKEMERKDPEFVIEEIERYVKERGVRDIAFYDDALLVNESSHLSVILEKIMDMKIDARLHAPNALHLRGMTPRLARLMKRSNFGTLRFGLETSDSQKQSATGGKVNNEEFEMAAAHLHEAGFSNADIGVYLLIGLPGQNTEDIERDIEFAIKHGARPHLAEFSPIPGTRIWSEAVRAARFDIEREPLFHNNSLLPCAIPELTPERLSSLKELCHQHDNELL